MAGIKIKKIMFLSAICLLLSFFLIGCIQTKDANNSSSYSNYRDIPGVTEREINAINNLKTSRGSITFSSLHGTEAFILPDGTHGGFISLLCDFLSDFFDIPFIPLINDWDILKNGIDDKTIDFTGELTPTAERKHFYYMTSPIAQRSLTVFTHKNYPELNTEYDLNGLKIGFSEGSVLSDLVHNSYHMLNFTSVGFSSIADAVLKLESGVINAFITETNEITALQDYPAIKNYDILPLIFVPFSLTTANDQFEPIISVIDKYLAAGGVNKFYEIYTNGKIEYNKYLFNQSLTESEFKFINSLLELNEKIPTALEPLNYPLCFYNERVNEFQGIAPDLLKQIKILTGIDFRIVNNKDSKWTDILDMLINGEAALVSELIRTEEREEMFLWPQEPYSNTQYAFISKSNYPDLEMYQVAQVKVGLVRGSAHDIKFNSWFPGNSNSKLYSDYDDAFDALENGGIDLLFTSENNLLAQLNYREKQGYKINIVLKSPIYSYFGINKNEKILCSIISKAQKYTDIQSIEDKWKNQTFDYSIKMANERFLYLFAISTGLILIIAILTIMTIMNKRKNKTILYQTNMLTAIYNTIPDSVFLKDKKGIYLSCNKRYEEFTGISADKIIGRTPFDVGAYDTANALFFTQTDIKVLNERKTSIDEMVITFPDKSRRPIEITKIPLLEGNNVIGLLGIGRDLSERKAAKNYEYAAKLSSTLARIAKSSAVSSGKLSEVCEIISKDGSKALDVHRLGIWKVNDDITMLKSITLYDNRTGERFVQNNFSLIDRSEYVKLLIKERVIAINDIRLHNVLSSLTEDYAPELCSLMDAPVWVNDKLEGIVSVEQDRCDSYRENRDWSIEEQNFVSSLADIMTITLTNFEKRKLMRRTENMMSNIPGMVYQSLNNPPDYPFSFVSEGSFSLFGIKPEELRNQSAQKLYDIMHHDDIINLKNLHSKQLSTGIPLEAIFRIRMEDDSEKWIWERSRIAEYNMDGTPNLIEGFFTDITEHRMLEVSRNKHEHDAEVERKANQTKSEFLAKMSHEIRTPMNAIIGMAELALREDSLSDNGREHIGMVRQAGLNLLSIVNDILDISKIESGKMEIVISNYSFSSLINDAISIIRMRIVDPQIVFAVKVDSHIPNTLIGDETRIRQILLNVLSNAAKYTEKGFVSFTTSFNSIDENNINIVFEVKDSGIGIKPENVDKLFDVFIQFDLERNIGIEGVGLGLAITQNLVKMMDGNINVETEYNKGSTFTITIPQKYNSSESIASVINPRDKNILLYYDQDAISVTSIVYAIENLGVKCFVIKDDEGLEAELKNNSYSQIFISRKLFEKNKNLIKDKFADIDIVVLIEFDEALPDESIRTLSMPAYCVSVANILNGTSGSLTFSNNREHVIRFSAPDAKILIIDDIYTNLKVAQGLLSPYNMEIDLCSSGKEAIKAVTKKYYDLLLMDHRMPEMDGIEAVKIIRSMNDPYFEALPIVVLTADAVSGKKKYFIENGFNDFISKPIDTVELNIILEKWIPKSKQKMNFNTVVVNEAKQYSGKKYETIDLEHGISVSGGSIKRYFETLAIFYKEGLEKIQSLKTCIEKKDFSLYTIYVHSIKSSAAYMGASALSEFAKNLEDAGKKENIKYILDNNDKFLIYMQKCLCEIQEALDICNKENNEIKNEDIDMEVVKSELEKLKQALKDLDINVINKTINSLRDFTSNNAVNSDINDIKNKILMAEYDEAVDLIDKILINYLLNA